MPRLFLHADQKRRGGLRSKDVSLGNLPSPGRSSSDRRFEKLPGEGLGVGAIEDAPAIKEAQPRRIRTSSQVLSAALCHSSLRRPGGAKDLTTGAREILTCTGAARPPYLHTCACGTVQAARKCGAGERGTSVGLQRCAPIERPGYGLRMTLTKRLPRARGRATTRIGMPRCPGRCPTAARPTPRRHPERPVSPPDVILSARG